MKIGDRVFVRGYIDEIRKDTVIIRNAGGYFGTIPSEVITGELPPAQPAVLACGNGELVKGSDGLVNDLVKDCISRQAAIDALKNRWKKTRNYEGIGDDIAEECELYLKQVPSAQPEQAVKDCRTCKHGKYNDYHDTYFCYNAEDCSNWDKWETSAQPEQPDIIRCRDCKHWEGENHGRFWYFEQCSLNQHVASCDDFCSYAERR